MADVMQEQKMYLEARLRECETAPDLNRSQIAEYRRYLEMLASSKDAAAYADAVASSGDMFSLSQAEQLDRCGNGLKIKNLFGDAKGAEAEQARLEAVKKAACHADLYDAVAGVSDRAGDMISRSRQAVERVMSLFSALVYYRTACASRKSAKKSEVRAAWKALQEMDPGVTFGRIVSYPPYRAVLPFDDGRLRRMETWLREAIG